MTFNKLITTVAALLISGSVAFATTGSDSNDAIEAFNNSSAVAEAISELLTTDTEIYFAETPSAIFLNGGCGFAGCDNTYLVALRYSTVRANPRSSSILAKVYVSPLDKPVVVILNNNKF